MPATAAAAATSDHMTLIEHLPYETDAGIAPRGRVGLIVLASDYTIEDEWRRIFAAVPGLALYQSRILNDPKITPETLRAMEPRITSATDVILPGASLDVVAYGCTSASMAIGEEKVFEKIHAARPNVKCTTPITAAFAAFEAFKAQRIGVLTPYRADVNRIVADYIRARGFDVPVFGSFNQEDDGIVSAITPAIHQGRCRAHRRDGIRRCGLCLVHLGQAGRCRRLDRGRDRPAGHLLQPRHGLACPAPGRRR